MKSTKQPVKSGFDDSLKATIYRLTDAQLSGAIVRCYATDLARALDLIHDLRWTLEFVDEKTRLEGRGAKVEQVLGLALNKFRKLTPLTELPKCAMEETVCGR